jgi:hypothetical protein
MFEKGIHTTANLSSGVNPELIRPKHAGFVLSARDTRLEKKKAVEPFENRSTLQEMIHE